MWGLPGANFTERSEDLPILRDSKKNLIKAPSPISRLISNAEKYSANTILIPNAQASIVGRVMVYVLEGSVEAANLSKRLDELFYVTM